MYSRTVLVVDDEPLIRMLLVEALEDEGFHVLEASNVLEAVVVFGTHDIDALVTDVDMPGPLNGFDLVDLVAKRGRRIAIVVTSGRHLGGDRVLPSSSKFLPKPYLVSEVLEALAEVVPIETSLAS
ncbi:response regulator [Neorhizobium sp. T6_25]|jgi:CheY-like chemotaxis protein|uniref:response regulator n=1 Tax=Neorhizobium sp. T6_25 TaxID=2093833 RepID=UPI000CFA5B5F|nr:response regulator [Neorhizobium sp. T6_25]